MSPSHVKFLLARRLLVGQLEVFGFDTIHATHGADVVVRRKVVFDMTLEAVEILFTRSFCVGRGHALPRSSCSNPPESPRPGPPRPAPPPGRARKRPQNHTIRSLTSVRNLTRAQQKKTKDGQKRRDVERTGAPTLDEGARMPQIERRPFRPSIFEPGGAPIVPLEYFARPCRE